MNRNLVLVDSSTNALVSTVRATALILAGSVLLAISAHVEMPFWPVPVTMQSFVVLMLGLGYSVPLAVITVFAYLIEGAVGLPVFAGGAGFAYMVGPTGGYLLGFFFAVLVLAMLRERGMAKSIPGLLISVLLADIIIFACGVSWLASYIGLNKALEVGVVPFILGDMLKVGLVVLTMELMKRYLGHGKN